MYWELHHPSRHFVFVDAIQNTIRVFGDQWFTVIPIWIFVIFGQLLVVYLKTLTCNLNVIKAQEVKPFENAAHQALVVLRSLEQLYSATNFLHRRFRLVLMANCCLIFIVMLTSAYYAIDSFSKSLIVVGFWSISNVLDPFTRFLAMCHISDQIRIAVSVHIYLANTKQ